MRGVLGARNAPIGTGKERLIGATGTVLTPLHADGIGQVRVADDTWSAQLEPLYRESSVAVGETIEVVEVRGVTLLVRPSLVAAPALPPGRRSRPLDRAANLTYTGIAAQGDELMDPSLIGAVVVAVVIILVFLWAARIVPEYRRLVVFRLGRSIGARGPGLVLLIPFIDRPVGVDLRERFFDVPPQSAISQDNASLSIDFIVYMRVVDPVSSVVEVEDFTGAARGIAITTLRAIVGDMMLDAVLSQRDQINEGMRTKLDEVTNRWGVKINAVEIREIQPPQDIQEAMTRQMSAERTRRAAVTEAEGQREATITVAEGNKQAAILNAEGNRQATILEAEGHRQEAILTPKALPKPCSVVRRRPAG